MRELPILLNGGMVRATMDGRKTQTRRPITRHAPEWVNSLLDPNLGWWRVQTDKYSYMSLLGCATLDEELEFCKDIAATFNPLGAPGDLLYVRETTQRWGGNRAQYQATLTPVIGDREHMCNGRAVWWYSRDVCPSIHMPKWAARTWLCNTCVGVEHGPDISEADARAEGFESADAFKAWWENQYPGLDWRWVTSYEVTER